MGHAQRVIGNTEAQIEGLQADALHELKMLKRKLLDVEQQLAVCIDTRIPYERARAR